MNISAIVYKSQTGFSKKYADIISEELGVRSYELDEAMKQLESGLDVIFVGSLMANMVVGEKEAIKKFHVVAIVANGMTETSKINTEELKSINQTGDLPIFYARGGLDFDKLKGFKKFIMKRILIGEAKKVSKTKEELKVKKEIALRNQDYVSKDNLKRFFDWLKKN